MPGLRACMNNMPNRCLENTLVDDHPNVSHHIVMLQAGAERRKT